WPAAVDDERRENIVLSQEGDEIDRRRREWGIRDRKGEVAGAPGPARAGGRRMIAEVLIEDNARGGQFVKGGRADPVVAVTAGVTEVESVDNDDERFHGRIIPRFIVSRWRAKR